jgi:hypothetical protein
MRISRRYSMKDGRRAIAFTPLIIWADRANRHWLRGFSTGLALPPISSRRRDAVSRLHHVRTGRRGPSCSGFTTGRYWFNHTFKPYAATRR